MKPNKPEWHYPTQPFHLNQAFGLYNPAYAQFGFMHHNGIDFAPGDGKEIRYPWSGTGKVTRIDNQPKGGGIYVTVRSNQPYEFPDGKIAYILTDFLHCEKVLVKLNHEVKTGDLLAIADNTGFSTGPHTHEQDRRVDVHGRFIDKNTPETPNGSFDPLPYASGVSAQIIGTIRETLARILLLVRTQLKIV